MATPNDSTKIECDTLRQTLKEWEKQFSAQHDGRKAGRDDIKSCPDIASKYKEYNRLRGLLSRATAPSSPTNRKAIRKAERPTSSRYHDLPSTPSRARRRSVASDSRASRETRTLLQDIRSPTPLLATPSASRTMIGPTPQRNGVVIGLFDMLTSETPTKNSRSALSDIATNTLQTPSRKQVQLDDEQCFTGNHKGSKTPMSAGKRFFLDKFAATPLKRKRDDEDDENILQHSSTPTFLRRDQALERISEGEEDKTPRPLPWKRNGFVRSLSSMIQSLKDRKEEEQQREEDRLDEELELLRELEAEQACETRPTKKPKILVQDSQAVEMPLGPDALLQSDSDDEGHGDQNRRIWKKKGLKRQTKRINMKPVRMKTLPAVDEFHQDAADGDSCAKPSEERGSGDEYNESDTGEEEDSVNARSNLTKRKSAAETQPVSQSKGGKIVRAARKVNEQAHANFRKLKIKNKNSKSQGRGRFGRGRR